MSNNRDSYLVPLLTDAKRLGREAVRRRKVFDEKSIPAEVIAEHEAEGWQVDRKRKRKTTVCATEVTLYFKEHLDSLFP